MPAFLAVDPGVSPTVCILWDDPGKLLVADFYDGDDTSFQTVIGGRNVRRPSAPLLRQVMQEALTDRIVIEDVGSMPGQGVSSMFAFGYASGLIEGVAAGLGLTIVRVRPQVWQRAVGFPPKQCGPARESHTKGLSRHIAANIAPNLAKVFEPKNSHNKADAFLMAWWSRGRA